LFPVVSFIFFSCFFFLVLFFFTCFLRALFTYYFSGIRRDIQTHFFTALAAFLFGFAGGCGTPSLSADSSHF
jgi:hypothetical protein